jgi:hypothetical protein
MVIKNHYHTVGNIDVFSQTARSFENAGFKYQTQGRRDRFFARQQFQEVIIYAYQKG